MNVEELVDQWPERWPRPTVGSTKNSHSQIKPFGRDFAGRDVATVTREEFRRWALDNPGRARYVRTMLYDALDAGIVKENVAAGVRIPQRRRGKIEPPTEAEVKRLVQAADNRSGYLGRMILIAAFTGLREGELRALADCDIVYRTGTDRPARLRVEYSVNREEKLVRPKTESSENVCAVLGAAADPRGWALRRGLWGRAGTKPDELGRYRLFPITRSARQAAWDRVRIDAELEAVRWHDLRHFCATWLLDQGATMDDVALQLRCSVEEVRKTYGHPDREAALSRLEEIAR